MKKIERISANEYSDLEELASMVYHNEWALVWEKDLDELEQQRDEAVKILISIYTSLDNGLVDHYEDVKKLLEKITGQTWEEIKAGYKND